MPRALPRPALPSLLLGLVLVFGAMTAGAQPTDTPARSAIVIDLTSGAILLDKNADVPMPPASMSKLMTLLLVFEEIQSGRLSLDDEFRISAKASKMGGSKMFIRQGEVVSVGDLLRGVIVQSGNDAAVALAEALAGTEDAFAVRMNTRAEELGFTGSHFANATGWPDPEQYMTPRDLARLAEIMIKEHPDLYKLFAETEFTWDGITQRNRNPLLSLGLGADGLKTGHTEEAGYGLVASATRGERRVVLVVAGLDTNSARRQESERLINWAFRAFETRVLFAAGETLAEAPVWIGARDRVALVPRDAVAVTAPFGALDEAAIAVRFEGPVPAPIAEGDAVGHVEITAPGLEPVHVPLYAATAVERGGILARMSAAAELLARRVLPSSLMDGQHADAGTE